jgi:MFS family permease
MSALIFFGPLIAGMWMMYKGVKDDEAWRSIRLIWFVLGFVLFSFGALRVAAATFSLLNAALEAADGDGNGEASRKSNSEPIFDNFPAPKGD